MAIEVVVGTALLGWAMLSLPKSLRRSLTRTRKTCCAFSANITAATVGRPVVWQAFSAWIVGIVFGLLLLSAVNTAIVALIGVLYMMAQDGEMPRQFARLNRHGVPRIPLLIAVRLSRLWCLQSTTNFDALAGLYAIGVVGRDHGQSRLMHV